MTHKSLHQPSSKLRVFKHPTYEWAPTNIVGEDWLAQSSDQEEVVARVIVIPEENLPVCYSSMHNVDPGKGQGMSRGATHLHLGRGGIEVNKGMGVKLYARSDVMQVHHRVLPV